jgi:hypothetical protein
MESFTFVEAEPPKRVAKRGKYEATIEEILKAKLTKPVKVELGETKAQSAYQSFNRIIKSKKYDNKLAIHKIGGEIYIEKI